MVKKENGCDNIMISEYLFEIGQMQMDGDEVGARSVERFERTVPTRMTQVQTRQTIATLGEKCVQR